MTGSLNADPNQVNSAGAQWALIIPHMGAQAPNVSGQWPTDAAAQAAVAAAGQTNQQLQNGLGQTAAGMGGAANAYSQQEGDNSAKLGDGTGPLADIGGLIIPFLTEGASLGGQLFSTGVSGALQVINQVTNAITAKNTGNIPSPPGAGIGLPPADQDQHTEDHHVDTASAAPAASASGEQHVELARGTAR